MLRSYNATESAHDFLAHVHDQEHESIRYFLQQLNFGDTQAIGARKASDWFPEQAVRRVIRHIRVGALQY